MCIFRGVQSSGKVSVLSFLAYFYYPLFKVAYFTAIFPYLVLLILIIFTATLQGAGDGIRFYVVPRWELIGDFKVHDDHKN